MSSYGYVGAGNPFFKPKTKPKKQPAVQQDVTLPTDFGSLITSAPQYTQGEAALTSVYNPNNPNLGSAANARREAVQNALVRYGVGSGFQHDTYGDADPTILDQARNNPHSVFAELLHNYQHNGVVGHNSLEERGILNSGATGQFDANLGYQYSKDQYDAVNALNDLISQAQGDYSGAGATYTTGHTALVNDVTDQLKQDPNVAAAGKAHLVAGSVAKYGQPLYRGPDGKLYTKAGKPYTPAVVAPHPGYGFGQQF